MNRLLLKKLIHSDSGQAVVEYALATLLTLVFVVALFGIYNKIKTAGDLAAFGSASSAGYTGLMSNVINTAFYVIPDPDRRQYLSIKPLGPISDIGLQ